MTARTKKGRFAPVPGGPVGADADRVTQAVIHQTVRHAALLEAPLGQFGPYSVPN